MPRLDVWDTAPAPVVDLDCGFVRRQIADKYRIGKELGTGGFGVVRVVTDDNGTEFACKSICKQLDIPNVSHGQIERHLDNIKREVAVLRKLRGTVSFLASRLPMHPPHCANITLQYLTSSPGPP